MPSEFTKAPAVAAIARELIDAHHQLLKVPGVRIEYRFVDPVPIKAGKEVWGTMRRVSGLNAHLAGSDCPFFVMTIAREVWDGLTDDQRRALVDHELCHARVELGDKGELKLVIAPHDLEEFCDIVRRHGLWREDVRRFRDACTDQLSLFPADEPVSKGA